MAVPVKKKQDETDDLVVGVTVQIPGGGVSQFCIRVVNAKNNVLPWQLSDAALRRDLVGALMRRFGGVVRLEPCSS
jgi:hypothetical protein